MRERTRLHLEPGPSRAKRGGACISLECYLVSILSPSASFFFSFFSPSNFLRPPTVRQTAERRGREREGRGKRRGNFFLCFVSVVHVFIFHHSFLPILIFFAKAAAHFIARVIKNKIAQQLLLHTATGNQQMCGKMQWCGDKNGSYTVTFE